MSQTRTHVRNDVLADLAPAEVAAWYRRLAGHVRARQPDSLAAQLLLWWLDGNGRPLIFPARYVWKLPYVRAHLRDHVRPVLLTHRKAAGRTGGHWGGVAHRLAQEPTPPHERTYSIWYEGPPVRTSRLCELGTQLRAGLGFDAHYDDGSLDVIMALNVFGLHTDVTLRATRLGAGQANSRHTYDVAFTAWTTYAFDRYDWDARGQSTLPNPDYGAPDGVAPHRRQVKVYHTHALRVEQAGLAAPFYVRSEPWLVTDPAICGPARITLTRRHPARSWANA